MISKKTLNEIALSVLHANKSINEQIKTVYVPNNEWDEVTRSRSKYADECWIIMICGARIRPLTDLANYNA